VQRKRKERGQAPEPRLKRRIGEEGPKTLATGRCSDAGGVVLCKERKRKERGQAPEPRSKRRMGKEGPKTLATGVAQSQEAPSWGKKSVYNQQTTHHIKSHFQKPRGGVFESGKSGGMS